MFDLEQAITEWRRTMLAAGIKTPTTLDELELHLRDEIERQMTSGLSTQAAFEIALQQLGHPQAVQAEFKKTEEAAAARAWKRKQTLLVAITGLVSFHASIMLLFRLGSFSGATTGQQIAGLAAVAAFNLLIQSARLTWRILPVIPVRRIRETISISGAALLTLWLAVFAWIILPRTDFMMSQLGVVLLWGFFPPIGIWMGLFCGLDIAARKKIVAG